MGITGNRGPTFHLICVGIMSINKSFKENLETEFTVYILQAITYRHFLQQSLETFWPLYF